MGKVGNIKLEMSGNQLLSLDRKPDVYGNYGDSKGGAD
jgi:hypothetical protein